MEAEYKKLTPEEKSKIETEIKLMLHASRDCLRNREIDTSRTAFNANDGYFGEAFGVMRGLAILGYGYYGANNIPHKEVAHWNLKWWFSELEQAVLAEENFGGSNQCDFCFDRYGRDFVRTRGRAQ